MQCDEVRLYLESYVKNELPYSLHKKIFNHINNCRNCSLDADVIKLIFHDSRLKNHTSTYISQKQEKGILKNKFNDLENYSFEEGLYNLKLSERSVSRIKVKKNRDGKFIVLATILSAVLFAAIIGFLFYNHESAAFLSVDKLYGDVFIGSKKIDSYGMLKPGEWLNTDENSKSRIKLGVLGEIEVEPSTQIKLLNINSSYNHFYLQSGKVKASVWGEPRRLFIDSPTGELIDFGSTFNFNVENDKSSIIKVESGWAALHFKDQFVIIPAGNECISKDVIGIPFNINSTKEFKEKLNDFLDNKISSVSEVLNAANKKDLISLWYLLVSSYQNERQVIFNKIKQLNSDVSRLNENQILKLDESALNNLWEVLGLGNKNYWKILRTTSSAKSSKEI